MKHLSAFAIFCEDVRRESGGRSTLIGIYPDSIDVPSFPGELRRLSVYFRVRFAADGTFDQPVAVDLEIDGGVVDHKAMEPVERGAIERAVARARERGIPYATITARMQLAEPIPFPAPTKIRAILKNGDESELCGILNVRAKSTEASATSSPPPSE